ncbi:hypothetical protein Pint_02951 [Pistacia integerrima]|uniref:Uncharacterized protein n=1 Tax=Pistacia integerrima TaxID=434235 RepID=A0ACC0ZM16_9ROSI|nr:hypothetical protein Pint_02951 [Pistacia integerrima]
MEAVFLLCSVIPLYFLLLPPFYLQFCSLYNIARDFNYRMCVKMFFHLEGK